MGAGAVETSRHGSGPNDTADGYSGSTTLAVGVGIGLVLGFDGPSSPEVR
jgi:hypothetical protein